MTKSLISGFKLICKWSEQESIFLVNLVYKANSFVNKRELEQRRRRNSKGNENGKKVILIALDWKKKTTLHLITLFCTFICCHCNTAKWKCGLRTRQRLIFFLFSWTSIQSFRIKPQSNLPTYEKMKEFGWNKCNKVWSNWNSIFIKRRLRNHRRLCCLSSLLLT